MSDGRFGAGAGVRGGGWAVLAAAMLTTTAAGAADCPPDSAQTAAARADLIAAARVVSVDGAKATLALQRVFKGDGDWQIEVQLPAGAATVRQGDSYLVFAQKTDAGFSVGPCSGTVPHAEAGAIIDGLGPGHKPGAASGAGGAGPTPPASGSAAPAKSSPVDPAAGGAAPVGAAGPPADGATPPPGSGGCAACSIDRSVSRSGWLALLALAGLAAIRRRRR